MKKLVWVAGLVLAVAIVYPNGVSLPSFSKPAESTPEVNVPADAEIVKLLANASAADKARIVSVYRGLKAVLNKDNGKRVNTTEKWEEVHGETLTLAIEPPGKYPGLDEAIEAVFYKAVQDKDTDASVVNAVTPLIQAKLVKACDTIIASAR
jgi:hypothetical protein